jgi:hypothetical protein
MTDEGRLARISARHEAATPGPWVGDRHDGTVKYEMRSAGGTLVLRVDHKNATSGFLGPNAIADEQLVLHAHADIGYLLMVVGWLRDALEEAIDEAGNGIMSPDIISSWGNVLDEVQYG